MMQLEVAETTGLSTHTTTPGISAPSVELLANGPDCSSIIAEQKAANFVLTNGHTCTRPQHTGDDDTSGHPAALVNPDKPPTVPMRNMGCKPKKRAKDKLLRDPMLAKQVMEVRKKTAFLGYTFRRMKVPAS